MQSLELIHLRLLGRPANAQTFGLVRLGNLYNSGKYMIFVDWNE